MNAVSLADFVDFVSKSGTPKLTQVRTAKNRGDYNPATDFWKAMREGIVDYHESGSGDKKQLDSIVKSLTDGKKSARYQECVSGYKKFLGNKKPAWIGTQTSMWSTAGLPIRVNPELGLEIKGAPHLIKLHFKADPIAKKRVDIILLLMKEALQAANGYQYAVLDVPRAKLFASDDPDPTLLPLLTGEAISFKAIWDAI